MGDAPAPAALDASAAKFPQGITTGSIDGDPSLGWGSQEADFYAITGDNAVTALEAIGSNHARIWHYRLYDTVNDPNGLIRNWLRSGLDLNSETAFTGPGFLKLEEYAGGDLPHQREEVG